MSSPLLPRLVLPRQLVEAGARAGADCSYHVTCHASGPGGPVRLYSGSAHCVISDDYKSDFSVQPSSSFYQTPPAELASIGSDFLDTLFSQPSEGLHLEGFDFDPTVQPSHMEEPYLSSQLSNSSQSLVTLTPVAQIDTNNNQCPPSADEVDTLASELLAQLPDDIAYQALSHDNDLRHEYVTDKNALIEILTSEKHVINESSTILFLDENNSDYNSGEYIAQESYQDMNDEVEKYMDEPLDCPSSKPKGKQYCQYCAKPFTTLSKLQSHILDEHKEIRRTLEPDNFICKTCNRKFSCHERWKSHKEAHLDPGLKCPRCTKVLGSKASLKAHVRIHERKHSCEYCTKTYETEQQLKSHAIKKHSTFNCDRCGFTCRNGSELDNHLQTHEDSNTIGDFDVPFFKDDFNLDDEDCTEDNDNIEDEDVVIDDGDIDLALVSNYDGKLEEDIIDLNGDDEFLQSIYGEDEESYENIGEASEDNSKLESAYKVVANIMKIESQNKHAKHKQKLNRDCHKCSKHFDRGSDFKRHAIEHVVQETMRAQRDTRGKHVFQCQLCPNRFIRMDKLKAHLRNHLKLRLYECNMCFKTFSDSSNYSKHKKVHGAAVYQCDTCKRKFNTKKMISQHMEYHRKTKPIACDYCDKVCYFESTLKKHINSQHRIKGKGAFSCQNCHLKFATMKHKWDHQWSEHGLRKKVNDCAKCHAKFRKLSELKKHTREEH